MFGHEKFIAYQRAITYISTSIQLINAVPRGNAILIDQLKRASFSIPLNIAEGAGKSSKAERNRFYMIARGSAMECAAIIDILHYLENVPVEILEISKKLLAEIVAILTAVCFKKEGKDHD